MKKKICFIGPLPPPIGGVAFMNHQFQMLLIENGLQIISFNTSKNTKSEDLYKRKGINEFIHLVSSILRFFYFIFTNRFEIVNIFVTSNLAFIRDAIFIVILKLFRKKIILHFHSKKQGEYFLDKKRIGYMSFFINMADKIILLSEDHKQYFQQYFDKEKVEIIENFIDYELYKCNISEKVDEFLYVGRLSEKKGFFDLLKAVSILKDKSLKINIIGLPDNEKTEHDIHKIIEENDIGNNFIFHGLQTGQLKYDLFKKCKYFIFPSHFENSPVVIKEAIAAKMALLVSNIDANKNILDDKQNKLYFEVSNEKDLSKRIINIREEGVFMELAKESTKIKEYDKNLAYKRLTTIMKKVSER